MSNGNKMGEVVILEDKAILRMALKRRGMRQEDVGNKIGIKRNAVSANMTRDHMGLDNFVKMLDAMEYDVYVVDRRTKEGVWCVDVEKNHEK